MHVLINAANLHVGGGVQVASSFINELSKILSENRTNLKVSILCSRKVYHNLDVDFCYNLFETFEIIDIYGAKPVPSKIKLLFKGYDICFTVFGPLYFTPQVGLHICGFAQPWIAYPNNDVYKKLKLKEFIYTKAKFFLQSLYFRRCDKLVVEQFHVKEALDSLNCQFPEIQVVSNCVSSIYDSPEKWSLIEPISISTKGAITLGFIGRPYTHKNIEILGKVSDILVEKYGTTSNFIFSFSDEEMEYCGFSKRENFYSVGELSSTQCPTFYSMIDALIFPSLLECFSATPIEAMKMETTVIASDLSFVREVCQQSAFYFDPLDADSIAMAINDVVTNSSLVLEKKSLGKKIVDKLPKAKDRALSYMKILNKNLS